jgi:hypothetical protein
LDHLCPYWRSYFLWPYFRFMPTFSGTKVGVKTRTWCTRKVFTRPYLTSGLYVRSYKSHI